MDISSNEWAAAKSLLILLSQALSSNEKTTGSSVGLAETALIAERVLNKPLGFSGDRFSHSVRLLSTLQAAQQQMAHWINALSEDSGTIQHPAPGYKVGKELGNLRVADLETSPKKTPPPLNERIESKAQRLVAEVRTAIQSLSTSYYLGDPQSSPLRAVLNKLKPLVDEYIEALSQISHDSHQEGSFTPFKHHQVSSFERKSRDENRIPLFLVEKSIKSGAIPSSLETDKLTSKSKPKLKEQASSRVPLSSQEESVESNETDITRPTDSKRSGEAKQEGPQPGSKKGEKQSESDLDLYKAKLLSPANSETMKQKIADPASHPICLPNTLAGQPPPLKGPLKKKKRKQYFFQDEEDDPRDSRES